MASGWANDDAVNEQINNTIEDAVARARGELPHGESRDECESCGDPIPEARRKAVPGVRLCISCQRFVAHLRNHQFPLFHMIKRRIQRHKAVAGFFF